MQQTALGSIPKPFLGSYLIFKRPFLPVVPALALGHVLEMHFFPCGLSPSSGWRKPRSPCLGSQGPQLALQLSRCCSFPKKTSKVWKFSL